MVPGLRRPLFPVLALMGLVLVGAVELAGARESAAPTGPCSEPVQTEGGRVSGMLEEATGTCRWLGVPYAAPPVGALRWQRPKPVLPWDGVREARSFAPSCSQTGAMVFVNADPSGEQSEDCLYLNIWRPQEPGEPLPVLVWVHGGGYSGGTPNTPMYHGGNLASRGRIVVVSVAYRLNIFGFFASQALVDEDPDGSAGNYALWDQIAALEWIRDNIAAFGGDPNRVTIAGESAGGWSVCNLLVSPPAEGLFQGAIMESGGCQSATTLARGFEVSAEAAARFGLDANDLEALRAIPARKLLRKGVDWENHGFKWLPRIDGVVLPAQPIDRIEANQYHHVPLIAGANRDEVNDSLYLHPFRFLHGKRRYPKRIAKSYGEDAVQGIVARYPAEAFERISDAYGKVATDAALLCPTMAGARAVAEHQDAVWLYRFDYDDVRFGRFVGAFHGSEIPFVFGNFEGWPASLFYTRRRARRAAPLADAIMGYWSRFVHTGDPNGPNGPFWPPLTDHDQFMRFDLKPEVVTLSREAIDRCTFWRNYAEAHPRFVESLGILGDGVTSNDDESTHRGADHD